MDERVRGVRLQRIQAGRAVHARETGRAETRGKKRRDCAQVVGARGRRLDGRRRQGPDAREERREQRDGRDAIHLTRYRPFVSVARRELCGGVQHVGVVVTTRLKRVNHEEFLVRSHRSCRAASWEGAGEMGGSIFWGTSFFIALEVCFYFFVNTNWKAGDRQ